MTQPARIPQPNIDLQEDATTVQLETEFLLKKLLYDKRFRRNVRLYLECDNKGWFKFKADNGEIVNCTFETV